jgi:CheY-like chemotaxis protein
MTAKKKIALLVDDEKEPLNLYKEVIEREGFGVITAEGATEAMRLFDSSGQINLVVTGIQMPENDVNGIWLMIKMKTREPKIPVIVLSSFNFENDHGIRSFANGYVVKDMKGPEALTEKIREIFG